MNKETYLKLPNITVGELQDVVNYLEENNIKYIEYYENEHKLKNALDEIENYLEANGYEYIYLDCKLIETQIYSDLKEIIKKAKGDVKNEN